MTMITPSYLGETIEYSSLHACRSTLEDPTNSPLSPLPATLTKTKDLKSFACHTFLNFMPVASYG